MLPTPENTSMPVSTTANPLVRSFSQKLARSISAISMNRKPSASAGKYNGGAQQPRRAGAQPSRRGQRHQQHQHGDHRRLRQHRQVHQPADFPLRQDLQPAQQRAKLVQPQHGIEIRPVQASSA